jgi:CheY-like chemotaxis protein
MVSVTDTGTGIPDANIGKVFEPFFTTKDVGKGTGLGLSMVYGFVKQSGGHITVNSELGRGTSIKLYLPRSSIVPDVQPNAEKEKRETSGTGAILVVEDEDLVRDNVQTQLTLLGYHVVAASDARQALEILGSGLAVDLVFTDIIMPGDMNGKQLADVVKTLRPDTKILFTSGYSEDTVVHDGRLDSGVRLLSKPYSRTELAQAVSRALREENGASA